MRGLFCGACVAIAAWAAPAGAEEQSELRNLLEEQSQIIQELRSELDRVRADQKRAEERVLALEDERATPAVSAPGASGEVSREWVDQRILDFQTADESRLFLSGYGRAEFVDVPNGDPSTFNLQFNPIFHYRLTGALHFNAELELELEDGETHVELEFATIDYLVNDWLTFSAGKFLTPFNVFGEKLHPPWINKLASRPVMYETRDGVPGVLPIISDVGVMLSGGTTLWDESSKMNYAVYVSNGPTLELEDGFPVLEFENTPDLNHNKAVGGRIGVLPLPNLEVGFSGMTGRDGEQFDLIGADVWYYIRGLELRGEFARLHANPTRWGYYLQAAYELGEQIEGTDALSRMASKLEPVVRWGQNLGDGPDRDQVALGLNYWLFPSVPLKFTYEINSEAVSDDRYFFQMAYGF